jgi:hypothetical protein
MSNDSILTMSNGCGVDLIAPRPDDIDFDSIAEHLAKVKRFNGATRGQEYSVAQHCVIGVDAILHETGNGQLAAYFLLHDGHEAFFGDDTTPKKRALAEIAHKKFGILAADILLAFDAMIASFDIEIHAKAGLAWPATLEMSAQIKLWDKRLFVTEWRDLMSNAVHPAWNNYRDILPLNERIIPWHWAWAARSFRDRCDSLLPNLGAPKQ